MHRVIVFGCNGMLGNYLSTYLQDFFQIIRVARTQFDVLKDSIFELDKLLQDINCNKSCVIVNCIGVIPQRDSNITRQEYIRVNSEFPHLLSAISDKYHSKLIHITTDCVFDGKEGNYTEDSMKTEKGIYGLSKSLGEPLNATCIRTSIIGRELKNKKSLLEWTLTQTQISGYVNHHWNGVTCLQLAKIIKNIIQSNMFWKGVRHIFSPRTVTKFELIEMIINVFKVSCDLKRFETNKVDKSLSSLYHVSHELCIPDIHNQIIELEQFKLFEE